MPFSGLFNTPRPGESHRGNDDKETVNLFPPKICSGVSTAQVTGLPNVSPPQGVQSDVGHDMLFGARKRPRDISLGQRSNYSGLETSSSVGDKLRRMVQQHQIETGGLIEENAKKLRMDFAGKQAQQAKLLVAAVREENLVKLKLKEDEMCRMGKINYFLNQKVKSLIQENQSLMNSAVTHEATITSLQAKLLESERRLLEANVTVHGDESCCGSNNINANQVNHTNVVSMDQGGYDVVNDCYVINQGGSIPGDSGYNMDQGGFAVGDVGYMMNDGVFGGVGDGVGDGDDGYLLDKYKCKSCGEREASVLVLPCRHLCLCPDCESSIRSTCPVCEVHMESSFHVNRF